MEPNYAEHETLMFSGHPTPEQCRRHGSTHKAYGWCPKPMGHWSPDCKTAYLDGYNSYKE